MPTLKDNSRTEYTGHGTIEHINAGSLQRIADSTEVIARNYNELIRERDNYKNWYNMSSEKVHQLEKRISALRGVITRMKKDRTR